MSNSRDERIRILLALQRRIYPLQDRLTMGEASQSDLYHYICDRLETLIDDRSIREILTDDDWRLADTIITESEKRGITISLGSIFRDPHFQIFDPPPIVFLCGQLPDPVAHPYIAFVGARKATRYGEGMTHRLVADLKPYRPTIVSGLAYGIDYESHRAAIASDCPTVAILGCGIDNPYPRRHLSLRDRIVEEGGAVISEFPWGTPPLSYNFPLRNRLISGLSRGVVVVEAMIKSGSLITARWAAEGGREVFAVPGSVGLRMSEGTNQLIKDGAYLVERGEEIADILRLKKGEDSATLKKNAGQGPKDDDIKRSIRRFIRSGRNDWGFLANETGLTVSELLRIKTEIELSL